MRIKLARTLFVVLLAWACAAAAQQRGQLPGAIDGPNSVIIHIRDVSGTPLPVVATVKIISNNADGGEQTLSTREGGRVTVSGLKPGRYDVEARAPGYDDAHEQLDIFGFDQGHCFITMKLAGTSSSAPTAEKPLFPPLTGKSRKELDLAVSALRDNNLPEAGKHIDYILKHAANHPDVQYVAATYAMRANDASGARQHLEAAVRIYPAHFAAQMTLGEMLVQQGDAAGALPHLTKAVESDPTSWRGHWLLAETDLRLKQQDLPGAKLHATRAIELGKDKSTQAIITLALAETFLGEKAAARDLLTEFVRDHPTEVESARARQILGSAELALPVVAAAHGPSEAAGAAPATASAGDAPSKASTDLSLGNAATDNVPMGSLPPEFLARLPRDIDAAVPTVESDVACSLPEVMKGAESRARQFAEALERFTAKEKILHEELNPAGGMKRSEERSFDYSAGLHRWPNDLVSVSEMRNGNLAPTFGNQFSVDFAAKGLPAMSVVFHPAYSGDFTFTCEGLGQSHGRPAWQVRFEQRPDRPARIHNWVIDGHSYPVLLKGRAWLSAGTFYILRVETDLAQPVNEIRLESQHMLIDYAPVKSASGKYELWLPQSAEIYSRFRGHTFHQRHDFSDFVLFSIDSNEKIKSSAEKKKTAN